VRRVKFRCEGRRKRTKEGLKSLPVQTAARMLMDREMNSRGIEEAQAGAPLEWISSMAQTGLARDLAARQREE